MQKQWTVRAFNLVEYNFPSRANQPKSKIQIFSVSLVAFLPFANTSPRTSNLFI